MIQQLRGKVAVVTGAASGIGRALAARLVREGMHVVIADFDAAALARTAKELGVMSVLTDVSQFDQVTALANAVRERHGTAHLVCNNAGAGVYAGFERLSLNDFKWMFDVNFWGAVHGMKAFLPLLRANPDGGHIVNTASLNGLSVLPGGSAYGATKYAIVALTETVAIELELEKVPIGITAFCPGPVRTDIGASGSKRAAAYGELPDASHGKDVAAEAFRSMMDTDALISPEQAADVAIEAVRAGRFWAITHPELTRPVTQRHAQIMAAAGVAPGA